jgi:hypothetical protein
MVGPSRRGSAQSLVLGSARPCRRHDTLEATESWDLELNPGVVEFDALGLEEAWDLVLNP